MMNPQSILLCCLLLLSGSSAFVTRSNIPSSWRAQTALSYGSENDHEGRRRQRLAHEKVLQKRFASGEELKTLRSDLEHLRENLTWAKAAKDPKRVNDLEEAIAQGEHRDAELVYKSTVKAIFELDKTPSTPEKDVLRERWAEAAAEARSCLPRFQLEGLWVGNYGDHGYEMINVTYYGDTIIATKVTGDQDIPRGAVSFNADLSPTEDLPPIDLSDDSASQWKTDKLTRYSGKGQTAKEGYTNNKFVDGQIIMFDDHFSFVWIPSRQHVLFARPSPQVTLRMLRDIISKEDEMANKRHHLEQCLEMDMTTSIARAFSGSGQEPFRRIRREHELKEIEEKNNVAPIFGFSDMFNVNKWRTYIDEVLNDDNNRKEDSSK